MYTVAGIVAEKVTNDSWENNLNHNIFEPLNMTRSFSSMDVAQDLLQNDDIAMPHTTHCIGNKTNMTTVPALNINMVAPAGSIVSTAEDMSKWMQFQLSNMAPKDMHTVQMAIPNSPLKDGLTVGYGLGWLITFYRGQYVVWHNGGIDGFNSVTVLFPEKKHGIVILANSDTVVEPIQELAFRIGDILANRSSTESHDEWVSQKAKLNVEMEKNETKIVREKTADQLAEYVGNFGNPGYGVIEVFVNKSQLFMLYNNLKYILKPQEGPDFFNVKRQSYQCTVGEQEASFLRDSSGQIIKFCMNFELALPVICFKKELSADLYHLDYLEKFEGNFEAGPVSLQINLNKKKLLLIAIGA